MDTFIDNALTGFSAQRRWVRVMLVLAAFFISGYVYTALFLPITILFEDSFLRNGLPIFLVVVLLAMSFLAFTFRAARKTRLDWLGLAILIPIAVPMTFALVMIGASIDDVIAHTYQLRAIGALVMLGATLSLGLIWAALRRVEGFDGSRGGARDALNQIGGIAGIAVLARIVTPAGELAELPVYSVTGAVFAGLASFVHFALRHDTIVRAFWPLVAVLGLVLFRLFDMEIWALDAAQLVEDHVTDRVEASRLITLSIAFAVVVFLTCIWAVVRHHLTDPGARAGAEAQHRAFMEFEFYGEGVTMKLERRFQYFWRDFFLFAFMLVFLGYAAMKGDLFTDADTSDLATFGIYLVLIGVVVMLWYGLPLRLFARRRFRLVTIWLVPVVTTILTGIVSGALINGLQLDDGSAFAVVLALLFFLPFPIMVAQSWFHLDRERLGIAVLVLVGYLLADMLFTTFLGREAATAFDLGLKIGDIGALVASLALLGVYLFNRNVPGAFLIWPAGAIASGLLLRIFIVVQSRVNEAAATVDVRTGMGEVWLAAGFGAFFGYLALVLKRIYYDCDPDARAQGIRLRGGVTILHAITPLLILAFILSGLNSFVGRAQVDTDLIAANATRIGESVVKIGDEVKETVSVLEEEADNLVEQAEAAVGEATALGRQLTREMELAAGEAVEGAKRVGTAIADDVIAEGKTLASDVGDHLSEAISLPPIDLGLFELEWPDLGIGDAIKDMFGGVFDSLLPDLDISGIFQNLLTKGLANIEREFAAPLARAEAMQTAVSNFASRQSQGVRNSLTAVQSQAAMATANVEAELGKAKEQFRQMAINVTSLLYSLLVFLVVLLVAALAMMVWRAMNGLYVMVDRVRTGWAMMMQRNEMDERTALA